jgi:hypothetical protein
MKLKGVSYDVGRVMGGNWRPEFDMTVVHRELAIIKNDLHCNAVRICGLSIPRLVAVTEDALQLGLEVWLSPEMWDRSPKATLNYIAKAAAAVEPVRQRWPDKIVFMVGSELTLFMQGIVSGRNVLQRMRNPKNVALMRSGGHNKPLNAFLKDATTAVRKVYQGKLSYASIIWEEVDWSLFDYVGVDHYRAARIKDRYVELLKPAFTHDRPVIITEFGYRSYKGADTSMADMAGDIVDPWSVLLHRIPIVGLFIRPRIDGDYARDEEMQARELVDQLDVLDRAGVAGTFIMTFVSPTSPFDPDPRYDLDMASYSLVKSFAKGKHGTTYPDMTWEPKKSFKAVADYYGSH